MVEKTCPLCEEPRDLMVVAEQWLLHEIAKEHPDWVAADGACAPCIAYYRSLDGAVEVDDSA